MATPPDPPAPSPPDALLADTAAANGASRLIQSIGGILANSRVYIGLALLIAIYLAYNVLGFYWRPQEKQISAAWNDGISKLGISPLYPPQEDFFVGDVWAMSQVAGDDPAPLGKNAIRVGHIPLNDWVRYNLADRPAFKQTPAKVQTEEFRALADEADIGVVDAGKLPVSLAAFPGVTILGTSTSDAGMTLASYVLGGSNALSSIEEIKIPTAETYGASIVDTFGAYTAWCGTPEYKGLCDDRLVRNLLSYVDSDVLRTTDDGQYVYELQLIVVYRVYLAREITRRRVLTDSRGMIAATASADPPPESEAVATSAAPPASRPGTTEALDAEAAQRAAAARARKPGGMGAGWQAGTSSALEMDSRIFQRPLAFGYRAMAIGLPRSAPSRESVQ